MKHILFSQIMTYLEMTPSFLKSSIYLEQNTPIKLKLIEMAEDIILKIGNGGQTDIVVLNFAKALEKVYHSLLT